LNAVWSQLVGLCDRFLKRTTGGRHGPVSRSPHHPSRYTVTGGMGRAGALEGSLRSDHCGDRQPLPRGVRPRRANPARLIEGSMPERRPDRVQYTYKRLQLNLVHDLRQTVIDRNPHLKFTTPVGSVLSRIYHVVASSAVQHSHIAAAKEERIPTTRKRDSWGLSGAHSRKDGTVGAHGGSPSW